jgi:hypothetical protein
MVGVTVDIRPVSQSLHQVRGTGWVLCVHSLFIGGAIVYIYDGDESGVLRNRVALPRDCFATELDCGHCNGQTVNYTLSMLQNTRCKFLFPQSVCRHVLFSLCFYRFSSEMLMGTVFNLSFFFLLFVKCLLRCPGQAFKNDNTLKE